VITLQSPQDKSQFNTNVAMVKGQVDDPSVNTITLLLNGIDQEMDVIDGVFSQEIELAEGTNTIQARASDSLGNVGTSREITVVVDTKPPESAPTDLHARIGQEGAQVILEWSSDPNADTYNIYRQSDAPITDVTNLTPLLTGIVDITAIDVQTQVGETYYYAVTSVDSAGNEGTTFTSSRNISLIWTKSGGVVSVEDARIVFSPGSLPTTQGAVAEISVRSLPHIDSATQQKIADADANTSGIVEIPDALKNAVWLIAAVTQAGGSISDIPGTTELTLPSGDVEGASIFILTDAGWKPAAKQQTVEEGLVTSQITQLGVFRVAVLTTPDWDVNNDNVINILDLTLIGLHFGEEGTDVVGDVNGDGRVDILDLTQVMLHFGETYEP
jgi:hypothetical protein